MPNQLLSAIICGTASVSKHLTALLHSLIRVKQEATDVRLLPGLAYAIRPDVVIVCCVAKYSCPLAHLRCLQTHLPHCPIIIYSDRSPEHWAEISPRALIHPKDDRMEWATCLRNLSNGRTYTSPLLASQATLQGADGSTRLTNMEQKVLNILKELPDVRPTELLHISKHTLKNHKTNIAKKLHLKSARELQKWIQENKK
ncbi:response regulator transcription factor [Rhodoflexus caldus]|uniref:hypothetical protein n=1 Tax=Rhodoflexus caldus TaxID=2891236 RepID=UPI00202A62C4|nr:hypothetical protein [Rhodoflexus caldus]